MQHEHGISHVSPKQTNCSLRDYITLTSLAQLRVLVLVNTIKV